MELCSVGYRIVCCYYYSLIGPRALQWMELTKCGSRLSWSLCHLVILDSSELGKSSKNQIWHFNPALYINSEVIHNECWSWGISENKPKILIKKFDQTCGFTNIMKANTIMLIFKICYFEYLLVIALSVMWIDNWSKILATLQQ